MLLVPDKNTEHAVRAVLEREHSLGIRKIAFDILVDPGRDGGVRLRGAQILQAQAGRYHHGGLIFDYEGSGANTAPMDLETQIDQQLNATWGLKAKAIVIEPEVDTWMWGAETHIKEVIGWDAEVGIRDWLRARGFVFTPDQKPVRPKEALEAVFREAKAPRSSAHYSSIASRLSLRNCTDPAFIRLRSALQSWFAAVDLA